MAVALLSASLLASTSSFAQTTPTPRTEGTKPGASIKIGVLTDLSGLYADLSGPGMVWATRKAVEDFNGQARGLKIEVISGDHQNKPDIGATIARKWYDVEEVDVIVDVVTSSVALAVSAIAKEKNRAVLVTTSATADLTGKACTPNTVHWTHDTVALANTTGKAIVKGGGDTWFFVTSDYAFGHALERDVGAVVTASGGTIAGSVRHPFPGSDFSSFLLQAQASKAKVVALANAGGDTINAIKQASEFGIVAGGQKLAGLLMYITDIHALGLEKAQGLTLATAWYWDMTDDNRKFAAEFAAANGGRKPTMAQAGAYAATLHYLKAAEAVKSGRDGAAVVSQMKAMPTDDKLFGKGTIRPDGRKLHPMYLVEVKKPAESKYSWDYYKVVAEIPANEAFRPLDKGGCPMIAGQ
jgi:branched-chain amino acid transport system substrate-binding protein